MSNLKSVAVISLLSCGTAAVAEDGLYYGVKLSYLDMSAGSFRPGAVSNQDVGVGGIVGYGFTTANNLRFAVEGTLELTGQSTFEYTRSSGEACSNTSPDWCEVKAIGRLRGVYTHDFRGYDIHSMAGVAVAAGRAEDGPDNYPETTAVGYTLGVALENGMGDGSIRYELSYDYFDQHRPERYNKDLEILSVGVSYMF